MTPVSLPYVDHWDGDCGFECYLGLEGQQWIHEFRPGEDMLVWLDNCGSAYYYKTVVDHSRLGGVGGVMTHLEVNFEDPDIAMLFKLTWL